MGVGWDNAAFLINGEYVFRFPSRKMGADLLANELRVLPFLALHLPLPIPHPSFFGQSTETYPFPFAGYRLLSGTTACRAELSDADRAACAPAVADFLRTLHSLAVSPEVKCWAPGDELRRADFASRAPRLIERLGAIPITSGLHRERLLELVRDLSAIPSPEREPCWVHGDLYARHLLVDETLRPCGVIDWGDVHLGDRALDLSFAFSFLPPEARGAFRAEYGEIEQATWARAQFRALHYGAILIEYGQDTGDTAIRQAGEYALRVAAG